MKQIILSAITLLGTFATAFSQSTIRIQNNTLCTIQAFVDETDPTCGLIPLGVYTIPALGFVDVPSISLTAEFKVLIAGAGAIRPVFTDPGCGVQSNTSFPAVFSCTPAMLIGTSDVVPPTGPTDRQVDVNN